MYLKLSAAKEFVRARLDELAAQNSDMFLDTVDDRNLDTTIETLIEEAITFVHLNAPAALMEGYLLTQDDFDHVELKDGVIDIDFSQESDLQDDVLRLVAFQSGDSQIKLTRAFYEDTPQARMQFNGFIKGQPDEPVLVQMDDSPDFRPHYRYYTTKATQPSFMLRYFPRPKRESRTFNPDGEGGGGTGGQASYGLSPDSLTYDSAGGTKSFRIMAPDGASWEIISSPSWLTLSPSRTSGSDTTEISATAPANMMQSERNSTIRVKIEGQSYTLAVKQYAKGADKEHSISIESSANHMFPGNGGTVNVKVTASDEWEIADYDAPWLTAVISGNTVTFSAAANEGSQRSVSVVFRLKDYPQYAATKVFIQGTAAMFDAYVDGTRDYNYGLIGETSSRMTNVRVAASTSDGTNCQIGIIVDANTAWTVTQETASKGWMSYRDSFGNSISKGDGSALIMVTVNANSSTSERTGPIFFYVGNQLKRTITITQAGLSQGGGGGSDPEPDVDELGFRETFVSEVNMENHIVTINKDAQDINVEVVSTKYPWIVTSSDRGKCAILSQDGQWFDKQMDASPSVVPFRIHIGENTSTECREFTVAFFLYVTADIRQYGTYTIRQLGSDEQPFIPELTVRATTSSQNVTIDANSKDYIMVDCESAGGYFSVDIESNCDSVALVEVTDADDTIAVSGGDGQYSVGINQGDLAVATLEARGYRGDNIVITKRIRVKRKDPQTITLVTKIIPDENCFASDDNNVEAKTYKGGSFVFKVTSNAAVSVSASEGDWFIIENGVEINTWKVTIREDTEERNGRIKITATLGEATQETYIFFSSPAAQEVQPSLTVRAGSNPIPDAGIPYTGGEYVYLVESNSSWGVAADETMGGSFATIRNSSGQVIYGGPSGVTEIHIIVPQNNVTKERIETLVFVIDNKQMLNMAINQKAYGTMEEEVKTPTYFEFSKPTAAYSASGDESVIGMEFYCTAGDYTWKVSSVLGTFTDPYSYDKEELNPSWASVSPMSGKGAGYASIFVSLGKNTTGANRYLSVELTSGEKTIVASVEQEPLSDDGGGTAPIPVKPWHTAVTPDFVDFPAEGGLQSIFLTSDLPWMVTDQPDWLAIHPDDRQSEDAVKEVRMVVDEENENEDWNEGFVVFSAEGADPLSVFVRQRSEAASISAVSAGNIIGHKAQMVDLLISASGPWEVDLQQTSDEMSPQRLTGVDGDVLTIAVGRNAQTEERALDLVVRLADGGAQCTKTIYQMGNHDIETEE